MTRIAVLSDIHANLPALEAVIADMAAFKPDRVIVIGDIINTGPFSVQVLERVIDVRWSLLRGNHEYYMLDYGTPREPPYRRGFTMPPWLNATIPRHWREFVAALPDTLLLAFQDSPLLRAAHGIPGDHFKGIYAIAPDDEVSMTLAGVAEPFLIIGHTHLPVDRVVTTPAGALRVFNPGSVGLTLDGWASHARYLILDGDWTGWRPTFRCIAYDQSNLFTEFDRIGYLEACGHVGRLLIDEFRTGQVRVVPFGHWLNSVHPGETANMALAEEFLMLDSNQIRPFMPLPFRQAVEDYEREQRLIVH